MSTVESTVLRLERTFRATPEQVFAAWTSPEVLSRWWRVDDSYAVAEVRAEPVPGGTYRLAMRHESGSTHAVRGEYLEVSPPHRLIYTWAWEEEGGGLGVSSTVTVTFEPEDEGTRVVIEHAGLPGAESRARHEAGWSGCLQTLRRDVFSEVNPNERSG